MSSSMKNSGVGWLGKVPSHWEVVQSRRMFQERNEKAKATDIQLTASQKYGLIPQTEFMEREGRRVVVVQKGQDILKHVSCGDFVISMRSFQGGLEYSEYEGSVSSAYVPLTPIKWVLPRYFRWLFKSTAYIQALQSTSDLVRDGQALRFDNFSKVPLPLVPEREQAAIADFLERETNRLDALIAKKIRFLELLREKIISLSTGAQVHKETKWVRLKHVSFEISRPVEQASNQNYIKLGLFNRGRGIFRKDPTETEEMGDSDFQWVQSGDLIISGQFAWEGAVALARDSHDGCVVSHRFPLLRGRKGEVLTDYLYAYFLTEHGNMILNDCSRGSAGRNKPLNLSLLMNWKIPVPPLEVQNQISELISLKEKMELLQLRSLNLLRERRVSAITNAVTGKIELG